MGHPLDEQLRELVQHHQLRTIPPLRCEVLSQAGDKLVLRLVLREDLRKLWGLDAGFQGVPLAPAAGWALTLAPGALVRLEFLGGDVGDPLAAYLSGTVLAASLVAAQVDVGGGGSTVKLAGGTQPVIRAGDVPAPLPTTLICAAPGSPVTGTYGTTPATMSKVLA